MKIKLLDPIDFLYGVMKVALTSVVGIIALVFFVLPMMFACAIAVAIAVVG